MIAMFRLLLLTVLCIELVSSDLTDRQRKALKDAHNQDRSIDATQGARSASDIRKMNWDPDLAARAQAYANKCIYVHSDSPGEGIGENLFISTGNLPEKGVENAVQFWYNEKRYYDFSTGKCTDGKVCGHYKQVVWAGATKVGCGLTFCPTMQGISWNDVYYVVCNYNKIVMKSKLPYVLAEPCSHCPPGYQRCSADTGNLCLYGSNKRTFKDILLEMMDRQKDNLDANNSVL